MRSQCAMQDTQGRLAEKKTCRLNVSLYVFLRSKFLQCIKNFASHENTNKEAHIFQRLKSQPGVS